MSITAAEAKAVLARLPRDEVETLQRLPPREALVILELHHRFPGSRLESVPESEEPYDPTTADIPY